MLALNLDVKKTIRIFERGWFFLKWPLSLLVFFLFIQTFFFTIFIVDGPSMEPTLKDNQILFVDRVSYFTRNPKAGDIIVMQFPGDTNQRIFVKRIIGLPSQNFQSSDQDHYGEVANKNFILGAGEYYVLGDNRDQSSDSRLWGPVSRENIIGHVL